MKLKCPKCGQEFEEHTTDVYFALGISLGALSMLVGILVGWAIGFHWL